MKSLISYDTLRLIELADPHVDVRKGSSNRVILNLILSSINKFQYRLNKEHWFFLVIKFRGAFTLHGEERRRINGCSRLFHVLIFFSFISLLLPRKCPPIHEEKRLGGSPTHLPRGSVSMKGGTSRPAPTHGFPQGRQYFVLFSFAYVRLFLYRLYRCPLTIPSSLINRRKSFSTFQISVTAKNSMSDLVLERIPRMREYSSTTEIHSKWKILIWENESRETISEQKI